MLPVPSTRHIAVFLWALRDSFSPRPVMLKPWEEFTLLSHEVRTSHPRT